MTKTMTVGFGSIILATTYYASLTQSTLFAFLMDMSPAAHILRATAVLLISLYCFSSSLRVPATKFAVQFAGLALIAFGLTGLLTGQLYSSFNYYALPLDMFFAINWGIVALVVAMELPLSQTPAFSVSHSRTKKTPAIRATAS